VVATGRVFAAEWPPRGDRSGAPRVIWQKALVRPWARVPWPSVS